MSTKWTTSILKHNETIPEANQGASNITRPLHDLMLILPQLCVQGTVIDFDACAPEVLVRLTEHATDTMNTTHRGMRTIGYLLAYCASDVPEGIPSDAIESLGWLLAELADAASLCDYLATTARRYIVDYSPTNGCGE